MQVFDGIGAVFQWFFECAQGDCSVLVYPTIRRQMTLRFDRIWQSFEAGGIS